MRAIYRLRLLVKLDTRTVPSSFIICLLARCCSLARTVPISRSLSACFSSYLWCSFVFVRVCVGGNRATR